jgi:hypothetical protein
LCHASSYTARDAGAEVVGAECAGVVFAFGGDEEEDGAFGRGFDPGPWYETLVDYAQKGVLSVDVYVSISGA